MTDNPPVGVKHALSTDGFAALRGAVGGAWLDHLGGALDDALARPSPLGQQFARGKGAFHSDLYLSVSFPAFGAFARESGIAEAVAAVAGLARVVLFCDELLVKEPDTPIETPWHHDYAYWPLAGEQAYTVWIPLDPVRRDTGALEFVRGSHRWGSVYHPKNFDTGAERVTAATEEPTPDVDAIVPAADRVVVDCEPGDCVVFHARTLHRASGNPSRVRRRRAIVLRLVGPDVRYDPRPRTLPLIWAPRLAPGQPLGDDPLFPTLWPRAA